MSQVWFLLSIMFRIKDTAITLSPENKQHFFMFLLSSEDLHKFLISLLLMAVCFYNPNEDRRTLNKITWSRNTRLKHVTV